MIVRPLDDGPGRIFVLVFRRGEAAVAGLRSFARERELDASHFTGIGAFREATLAFFDGERKEYLEIPVQEQMEVASLTGNIAMGPGGEARIHAHAVLSDRRGRTVAGHLVEGRVRPTLEVFLAATGSRLQRRHDPETGLPLIG